MSLQELEKVWKQKRAGRAVAAPAPPENREADLYDRAVELGFVPPADAGPVSLEVLTAGDLFRLLPAEEWERVREAFGLSSPVPGGWGPCRKCGGTDFRQGPGKGRHAARLVCAGCGLFLRWLPRALVGVAAGAGGQEALEEDRGLFELG